MLFDFSKKPGKVAFNRNLVTDELPLISVITPYYNACKYFKELYPCVMNQTFPWFEWIIVDDGSNKPEDLQLLTEVEKSDRRIQVLHKQNGGISSARNVGIKASSTDIIVTLDADELVEPTYFELLYWALYYNPKASWAYSDNVGFQNQEYVWRYLFNAKELKTYNFLVESAAIRKKELQEVGCYDEVEKHYFEDWRLWLKLLSKSKYPVHISSLEFWYRRTDTGVLTIVNVDSSIKQKADLLISEAAATVDETVQAKIFDVDSRETHFAIPKRTSFHKPYFTLKNKTQILFLIPWMVTGGADQFNLDFVRLLDKNQYEITIICTVPSDNPWKQRFREFTPSIFCLPEFLDVENYAEFVSYIIETREIDICLISNSYYGYYLAPWLRMEYPKMAIIDYVHMEEWYWRSGGYARTSMAMSDVIEKTYVCNNATRNEFYQNFNRKKEDVETIHIGVDQDKYYPAKCEYGIVRKRFQISDQEKIVLFPCRLHAQKRPYLMIEIARRVTRQDKSIRFLVVGDGAEREGIQNRINDYHLENFVIMAGEQSDMVPYYRDADLTLICSLMEGLSLTAYESCAMMTPVITSDVGGQTDLIDTTVGRVIPCMQSKENISSTTFNEQEVNQYVSAILELLNPEFKNEYDTLCRNCRAKIEQAFSLDTMIKKMSSALEDCLSEKKKAERQITANAIQHFKHLTEDYMVIYSEYERLDRECGILSWQLSQTQQELENKRSQAVYYKNEYLNINHSFSYNAGKRITWFPRKLYRGCRCISDHGLIYTVKYALRKMKGKQ